jgi:hypothetical protein
MARAQLKSLDTILRAAHEWALVGQYYHINVYADLKIGFRMPYAGYLGTDGLQNAVQVVKQKDRRGFVVPQMYKVLNRNGKPIFSAHRTWFTFIEYDMPERVEPLPDVQEIAVAVTEQGIPVIPAGESSNEIPSIHDDIVTSLKRKNDPNIYWTAEAAEPEWVDIDKKAEEIKIEVNQLTELSWDQLFEV